MNNNVQDDGSLAALCIPEDPNNRQFNCPEITQQKLINRTFKIMDFIKGIKTKFSKDGANDRYLVKIEIDGEIRKFFTNSHEIKRVLDIIRERNAFPRTATMRASGTRYWLE